MNASESDLAGRPTYYVLQSPPSACDNPLPGQLKADSFADALTQYHRSRGRHVLTEYEQRTFDDVRAPNWSNNLTEFHSHIAGHADRVELIFGCTQIDQARQLTKTLARMDVMMANAPRVRGLALGLVTDDDHVPIPTAQPYIDRYGADTVRCYMIFMGPHEHDLPWSQGQIGGVHRFLSRLSRLAQDMSISNYFAKLTRRSTMSPKQSRATCAFTWRSPRLCSLSVPPSDSVPR
jgi:hypothetical protein